MAISYKDISNRMYPPSPPQSLRELAGYFRWPDGILPPVSLAGLASRVARPDTVLIPFLSYNTYLMRVDIPAGTFVDSIFTVASLLRYLHLNALDILHSMRVTGAQALEKLGVGLAAGLFGGLNPFAAIAGLALEEVLSILRVSPEDLLSKLVSPSRILDLLGMDYHIPTTHKDALELRGTELGQELAGRYSVMALCEVWQTDSMNRILRGWSNNAPHVARGPQLEDADDKARTAIGSGLAVLSVLPIRETISHIYIQQGVDREIPVANVNLNHLVDVDTWAKKSVMLNRIDTGRGIIDLYSTHLYSGGDAIKFLGWAGIGEPTEEEKRAVRINQIREFINFYRATHQVQNVAILTGDFNINAMNQDLFHELNNLLSSAGFEELWSKPAYKNFMDAGQTNRNSENEIKESFIQNCLRWNPDLFPPVSNNTIDYYCNDVQTPIPGAPGERIDYIFIELPTAAHNFTLEVTRLRRRPFLRNAVTENEHYLSDHMGLDIKMFVTPT